MLCIRQLTRGFATNFVRCISMKANTAPPITSVAPFFNVSTPWIWQKPEPIKLPINIKQTNISDNILQIHPLIEPVNPVTDSIMEDPLITNNIHKEAARLIVIRRKKMKKHKLKKLRKRMKYEWAKVRQRRELKKEKEFQGILIAQCKEAEAFNAEEFVANKIKQATEKPPLPFTETDEFKQLMRRKNLRLYQYK